MSRKLEMVHTRTLGGPTAPPRIPRPAHYGAREQLALSSTCVRISDTAVNPRK